MRHIGLIGMLALGACATMAEPEPKEPPLTGTITLGSGGCPGLCAVYTMILYPDDTYALTAGENTISPGRSRGSLPVNSFRRAVEALEQYDMPGLQRFYTSTEVANCPTTITGLPTVDFSRVDDEKDTRSFVTFDTGCVDFADRDRIDQLHERLRTIFRIREIVAVGEPPRPPRPETAAPVQGLGGL